MAQLAATRVNKAIALGQRTLLAASHDGSPTAREVAIAAAKGDAVAQGIVNTVGEKLGETLAILIDVLNPECIAIGGLALRFGEQLLAPARKVIQREALPALAQACRIVPAALGEQIGDVAALCVALDGLSRPATEDLREAIEPRQMWQGV